MARARGCPVNTIAFVQARLGGGTRFGGAKIMLDLGGRTMLQRVMERLAKATLLSERVVVIPNAPEEDELATYCEDNGWKYVRTQTKLLSSGAYDVLGAYAAAAIRYRANPIVRVTADCPLLDWRVTDAVVDLYQNGGKFDYVSNNLERTFPHGLDVECFSARALKEADANARGEFDREHVTEYIRRHQDKPYRLANLRFPVESAEKPIHAAILVAARLTVDYPEDAALVRAIYAAFPEDHYITTADVVGLLAERPELMALNEQRAADHVQRLTGAFEPASEAVVNAGKRVVLH